VSNDKASQNEYLLELDAISTYYGDHQVLDQVSLNLKHGEVVCLIGPSGSGKSTLLRCVNHLVPISAGSIRLNGEVIGYREHDGTHRRLTEKEQATQRQSMGMVFQSFNLFPHLTVTENITLAPVLQGKAGKAEALQRAEQLLRSMSLFEKRDSYPRQLSGGQQQRVAIARALAMDPLLMLFDEPTSALDPELVGEVLDVMRELAQSGMSMIVVTHEMSFASEVADRIIFMDEGRIIFEGSPSAVLECKTNARLEKFLSAIA
jgi:polar amino acid transport system ATP-binding protein